MNKLRKYKVSSSMNILVGILVILVSCGLAGVFLYHFLKVVHTKLGRSRSVRAIQQIRAQHENEKIILEFLGRGERLTNNHIQKLLSVSYASTMQYLDDLEEEGLIQQVGISDKGIYYERITS